MYMCVCVYVYMCICDMCMCVYVYVCICVCVYMCICVYVYMCICVYVYMCICVYVCMPALALFKTTGSLPEAERTRWNSHDGDGSAAKAVFVLTMCPCSADATLCIERFRPPPFPRRSEIEFSLTAGSVPCASCCASSAHSKCELRLNVAVSAPRGTINARSANRILCTRRDTRNWCADAAHRQFTRA